MRVWRSLDDIEDVTRSVVAIGNFDGMHRGHARVVDLVVTRALEINSESVVVTFHPHPMSVIHPGSAPLALTRLEQRLRLLAARGVNETLVLPFTAELAQLTPEQFAKQVLVEGLHVTEVYVGENFRFGHRAAGTVETLRELGTSYDFTVHPVPLASDGPVWSSSYVRQCIAEGDVRAAAQALGRLHRVQGPVVVGDRRGRELGYPTANLDLDERDAVPADGIYAGWLIRADDEPLPAAISIGTNPTFGGTSRRVEAHVLDRDDLELYGEQVAIEFLARLRETLRFDGVEPLLAQIAVDVDRTRSLTEASRHPEGKPSDDPEGNQSRGYERRTRT